MIDNERYKRQTIIPEHGAGGQAKLKASSVLIVGAGGLGSPVAIYLAAAGVGRITIIDDDRIDLSNLHRQVWYTQDDIGKGKAKTLATYAQKQNPYVEVRHIDHRLNKSNIKSLFEDHDIIVDCTDNFMSRYLINDAAVQFKKPLVFGAIYRYEGQVAVFNGTMEDGSCSPNYRDVFPDQFANGSIPNCAEAGVIGFLPGVIGSMQAAEVAKLITMVGRPLIGQMLNINLKTNEYFTLRLKKVFDNSKIDIQNTNYDYFCENLNDKMKTINVQELKQLLAEKKDIQIIDVREAHEYAEVNMGAQLMPLSELHKHVNDIEDNKMVIVHCRSGARSASAIDHLTKEHGFDNLYNLEGGILAWVDAQ